MKNAKESMRYLASKISAYFHHSPAPCEKPDPSGMDQPIVSKSAC